MAGGNYSARITERGGGIVIVDYNCKVGEGEKETLVEKEGSERRSRTQWRIFCNVDDVGTISVMPPGRERKCDKQPAPTRIPRKLEETRGQRGIGQEIPPMGGKERRKLPARLIYFNILGTGRPRVL